MVYHQVVPATTDAGQSLAAITHCHLLWTTFAETDCDSNAFFPEVSPSWGVFIHPASPDPCQVVLCSCSSSVEVSIVALGLILSVSTLCDPLCECIVTCIWVLWTVHNSQSPFLCHQIDLTATDQLFWINSSKIEITAPKESLWMTPWLLQLVIFILLPLC